MEEVDHNSSVLPWETVNNLTKNQGLLPMDGSSLAGLYGHLCFKTYAGTLLIEKAEKTAALVRSSLP